MCPRTNTYKKYILCGATGHKLPVGACNKYAYGLHMCLDDPVAPQKFDFRRMENGGIVWDYCRFCKEGKDIEGDYLYGQSWEGTSKYREGG
ncbi:hypothetical protein SLS59_000847 [Nothophoma quercina]|uniref:Uncharacterized protein n=1 Tax=Nothophoma quercina TaxID=749835 RepID=A0ABR3S3E9_9PLEO